ncbi:hypothetical protein LJC60_01045 [Ruminococcaceae bacterium OttesenSCG-928-D13]|nr:hypothetical protein [Ruminococcaceae bacterium OttesenSCG-928-D13]
MDINEMVKEVHENAKAHGWWDGEERTFGELIALCHSELSEALEEYRDNRDMVWHACNAADGSPCVREGCGDYYERGCELDEMNSKPEGIAVELADCVIRIMDMCGHYGIDLAATIAEKHEYNKSRPYKHGGKVI